MIVLLRHGQTCGNVSKANYIDVDENEMILTERGNNEMLGLATTLQQLDIPVSRVLLAPERRCRDSALLLGLPAEASEVDERLRSQSWGSLTFPGVRETLTRSKSWPSGLDVRFPDGETAREVLERCRPVADELRTRELTEPGMLHAVVTHGVIIKLLLAQWLSWSDTQIEATPSIAIGTGLMITFSAAERAVAVHYELLVPA